MVRISDRSIEAALNSAASYSHNHMHTLLNITYTNEHGQPQHVQVIQPHGTGGGYYVYVNGYFKGQVVRTTRG